MVSACLALSSGCGGGALNWEVDRPETHVVRSGETLYAIAWRYRIDVRRLAAWNGLGDGSLIHPGQRIRLRPGAIAAADTSASRSGRARPDPAQPRSDMLPPPWRWPTEGSVSARFGQDKRARTGILIDGRPGQDILAAADGEVVYAGSGLIGYGNLVIIKHNTTYLSAYGHNEALEVEEGQSVRRGQRIARMGEGPGQRPRLHFEIRRNGDPVDPETFLPDR